MSNLTLLQAGATGFLLLVFVCAIAAPAFYWLLLGGALAGGVGFLALRHTVLFCVVWLLVTGLSLEMALNDLIGPEAFPATIAAVKGAGIALVAICAWRYGPRLDLFNPAWAFLVMAATGPMHGLYPGLTAGDSFRSLIGSVAPYAFGFARLSHSLAQAIIRATIWCPLVAVAVGSVLAAIGLRPLFVDSGGARLAALGHPAFLAGVCLPAIYAGLIELWRDGRSRDHVLLGVNLLILVLTGARAPLFYAVAVIGLTLLMVPSVKVPQRQRLLVVLLAGALLPAWPSFASLDASAGLGCTLPHFAQVVPAGRISSTEYLCHASAPSSWNRPTTRRFNAASFSGVWHLLHRKTAIGTPHSRWREMHQSGRVAIMFEMRSCPHAGSQVTRLISSSARCRNVVSLPSAFFSGVSMPMNHCSVARKITGLWQRQQWG